MQVKLVLQRNRLYVESPDKSILEALLEHAVIAEAHDASGGGGIRAGAGRRDTAAQAFTSTMEQLDLSKAAATADAAAAGPAAPMAPARASARDEEDAMREEYEAMQREREGEDEALEAERSMADPKPPSQGRAGAGTGSGPAAAHHARDAAEAAHAVEAVAARSGAASGAAAQTGAAGAAADGAPQAAGAVGTGPASCEHTRHVPYAQASAVEEADPGDQIYSFQIAASHVRSACSSLHVLRHAVIHKQVLGADDGSLQGAHDAAATCGCFACTAQDRCTSFAESHCVLMSN